jgi:nitroreductase
MLKEIQERRSIRAYRPDPVPVDLIETVLLAGSLAPSSKNRQPWRFTVVRGDEKKQALAVMREGLAREARQPLLPDSAPFLGGASRSLAVMESAPVVVFVTDSISCNLSAPASMDGRVSDICNAQSIGACVQNMCLQANALGLGCLWICDIFFAWDELRRWLEGFPAAALALGFPDECPPTRPRLPLSQLVRWRGFGEVIT